MSLTELFGVALLLFIVYKFFAMRGAAMKTAKSMQDLKLPDVSSARPQAPKRRATTPARKRRTNVSYLKPVQ